MPGIRLSQRKGGKFFKIKNFAPCWDTKKKFIWLGWAIASLATVPGGTFKLKQWNNNASEKFTASLYLYVFDSILMQCAMCNVPVPDLFLFLCPCLCRLFPCLCHLFPWRQKQPKLIEVTVFVTKNLRNRLCHHLFQHLAPSKDESDASSLGRKMASKAVTSFT